MPEKMSEGKSEKLAAELNAIGNEGLVIEQNDTNVQPNDNNVEVTVLNEVTEEQKPIDAIETPKDVEDKEDIVVVNTVNNDNSCIFITEKDTFDIKVKWYKIEDILYVDDSDTEFDNSKGNFNEFTVTLKYPSQGDYESIMSNTSYRTPDEIKLSDIMHMELTRLVTLIRKWSLEQDLSRMVELDPAIIKGILKKIRDKIGMKGIL
jgi:hypothetical protein